MYWFDNVDEALITIGRDRGKKAAVARVGGFLRSRVPGINVSGCVEGHAAQATSEDSYHDRQDELQGLVYRARHPVQ